MKTIRVILKIGIVVELKWPLPRSCKRLLSPFNVLEVRSDLILTNTCDRNILSYLARDLIESAAAEDLMHLPPYMSINNATIDV